MFKVLSLTIFFGVSAIIGVEAASKDAFTGDQLTAIDQRIGEYLKNNPEAMVKALQDFSMQQQKNALEKLQNGVKNSATELTDTKNAIVIGKSDAAVKLILFVDPNCPHCRTFEAVFNKIEKDLPNRDKLCLLIRQWPVLGDKSRDVAAGLIAANSQDPRKFQALSKEIIESDKAWDKEQFLTAAGKAGYDVNKIKTALGEKSIRDQMDNTKELATKIGLEGTPAIILADKNGARLVQVVDEEQLKTLLTEAIKAA